ncbi:MAG: hypothetical protein RSE46_12700, partial [Janthinobacterium sp.]
TAPPWEDSGISPILRGHNYTKSQAFQAQRVPLALLDGVTVMPQDRRAASSLPISPRHAGHGPGQINVALDKHQFPTFRCENRPLH